ncbi:SsrA-binding protein SmpB [Lyticum sinuosum]|uniref:SsrA-binding protein n=1 Tax=Lyticum sinuosum TaxID=1332059 RepID=A0AAE4VLE0_9RICK|nr:SsrA-binding protein SmpB [Lyticum sinuosum]MDZ5761594.1 SsrA-binding protein [Lyticum sinuosum]
MATKSIPDSNIYHLISNNNKASFNYNIEDVIETGIVLTGSEIKSLRNYKTNITDSHAIVENEEVFLHNLHINEYIEANRYNHYPKRPKKLLLHKNQIRKLIGTFKKKNIALIPLKIYFNHRNIVKILLSIATGKKNHDKRAAIKERDIERSLRRGME